MVDYNIEPVRAKGNQNIEKNSRNNRKKLKYKKKANLFGGLFRDFATELGDRVVDGIVFVSPVQVELSNVKQVRTLIPGTGVNELKDVDMILCRVNVGRSRRVGGGVSPVPDCHPTTEH